MRKQRLEDFLLIDGYESSGIQSVTKPTYMAKGSRNILMTSANRPSGYKGTELQNFKVGSRILMNAGDSYGGLGNFSNAANQHGSMVRVLAGLFFAGNGNLHYDGVDLGVNATSILQLRLLASGSFAGATFQAGLSQSSAPTIATLDTLGAGLTGRLRNGSYSVKVYKIRSATGAKSIASEASEVAVAVENNGIGRSMRVTVPLADTNGGDTWGICVTPRNFGSTGPHFLLREVAETDLTTIDSVPRSIELEWTDADLVGQPLAPIESFPPPACVFVGALGNSVFVDGCYGDTVTGVTAADPGSVMAISLPFRTEEFPRDWLEFPPDSPTALIRGGDGFYYRFGRNSMGVVSYVGGEPPITYQLFWGATGINFQHNAVVAEGGRLYAKTGAKGLVRIGNNSEPETLWAAPIVDDIEDWTDRATVLGWDEDNQTVCVMNGQTILPFNSTLEKWGSPITANVEGNIISAVTEDGALLISAEDIDTNQIRLYKFNSGNGSVMEVFTDWHHSEGETDTIRQIEVKMRSDNTNPITIRVYKDYDLTTPILQDTITPTNTGLHQFLGFRGILSDLQAFTVYLRQESSGGDAGFERIMVNGMVKEIVR